MIDRKTLERLHCPYCASSLSCRTELQAGAAGEIRYGILECSCYRYPVIEGIAVLRQRSAADGNRDPGVVFLESGDCEGALNHALANAPVAGVQSRSRGGLAGRLAALFPPSQSRSNGGLGGCATFRDAVNYCRPEAYAHYLLHRYANNSFLAAIPLFLLLKELGERPLRCLDLNCGAGHASFLIQALFPNVSAVATDHDFVNLYMASRYIVPERTICLCLDAEAPLPFADSFFDAMICMDGLHYIRGKRALARELDRIGAEDAIWLFPHMHNALKENISAGTPLSPGDYRRCLDCLPPLLLLNEANVFERFMRDGSLDLNRRPGADGLDAAGVLSGVASRRENLWRDHAGIVGTLLERKPQLRVNPIYRSTEEPGGGVRLEMSWPSERLQNECRAVESYLPRQPRIDAPVWEHLRNGEPVPAAAEDLVRSFVLVPLPEKYV